MSKPFESAIKTLQEAIDKCVLWEDGEDCSACDERRAAISVLEAAGKVDKELAIKTLRRLYHPRFNQGPDPVSVPIFDALMPLLEALPDEVK